MMGNYVQIVPGIKFLVVTSPCETLKINWPGTGIFEEREMVVFILGGRVGGKLGSREILVRAKLF